MSDPAPGMLGEQEPNGVSVGAWLGGRLVLAQPLKGHRVGSDAALLAAAADLAEGRLVDVGAGVGAVGLAILARSARGVADLIEVDARSAGLATENAARNGLGARAMVARVDVFDARARRTAGVADEAAALVVTNPPFFAPGAVRASADPGRARAHVFGADAGAEPLAGWIRACLSVLAPGGRFVMIHRPDALAAILAAAGNRLGALALLPVHPRAGASAHRLLVSGVKGSKAPLRIAPALVLHQTDGRLTPEADALHRGEGLIDWGGGGPP
ncbi:tRNA1(Val) A37 N6-methylase TrmN6 [Roseiarcus fermentans]|uniref:tRNA1(Val) A37 N6-methylase TrmN6 n=1 Tax=Roseiarcus fermentans TaxID=1473586 RepID=A0A366F984_9HYPH|nr:methyltransferase [Roseiarcus fermentans]RBP11187.1 tRNA1(Val) A37 N6-methylase TrmN6 [Roseiarcus fermentans]